MLAIQAVDRRPIYYMYTRMRACSACSMYSTLACAVIQMSWARPESLDKMKKDASEVDALLRKALDAQRAEDEEVVFREEERLFEQRHRREALDRSTPSHRMSAALLLQSVTQNNFIRFSFFCHDSKYLKQ